MLSISRRSRHKSGRPQPVRQPQDAAAQPTDASDWLTAAQYARIAAAFIVLAVVARSVRFVLRFPLWEDECFLVSNFIHCGFADLLKPLNYHQAAPLGFLAGELAAVQLLGFNEWSLRLLPFAGGIGSVFLFHRLAGQLLNGAAKALAIATFCASYSGIRYAAEAKPYGMDLFVSLLLLTLAVEWWRSRRIRWLIVLTSVVPPAVVTSYPATFVAGGISLFIAWELLRGDHVKPRSGEAERPPAAGRPREWLAWTAFNAVIVTSFWLLLRFVVKSQAEAELGWMQDYWKDQLPSPLEPLRLFAWLLSTHTGNLLAIPAGSGRGGSTISFLLVAIGVTVLCRTRRLGLAVLCLSPAALNLLAAFMGRYPYGGHVKFSQYLVPAICCLIGLGGAALVGMGRVDRAGGRRRLVFGLAVLTLIPLGTMARDFAMPYKSPTDARYRDFARWFWPSVEFGGEAACLHTDLGREFAPGTFHHLGWSAMYLCNQRIYSPRHRLGRPLDWGRVSADWPLHCVEYRAQVYEYDESACRAWLEEMNRRFRLVSRDEFPSPVFDQRGHHLLCADRLVIYKFVPRSSLLRDARPNLTKSATRR